MLAQARRIRLPCHDYSENDLAAAPEASRVPRISTQLEPGRNVQLIGTDLCMPIFSRFAAGLPQELQNTPPLAFVNPVSTSG